jgi:hypothetical protein
MASVLAQLPRFAFELDPLIAEAKRRAWHRRILLSAVAVLVVAGTVGGWLALRSSGGVTGLCASAPAGLTERSFPKTRMSEATVVLTNFRFGSVDDFYGIGASAGRQWPRGGITIAVINEGPDASPPVRSALRATNADFQGFEGSTWPVAHVAVRSQGRFLDAYAEVRTVTPAAIATVNRALAGVRACST